MRENSRLSTEIGGESTSPLTGGGASTWRGEVEVFDVDVER